MANFNDIKQRTTDVIHDNESGEITSLNLRLLVLDIIDDINAKKLDNLYIKDGDNYCITIGDKIFSIEPYHQTQVVYGDISILSFSYPDISDLGGTSTPTVTYSQTKTTYTDGLISNIETITSGATKSFSANSILNATLNASTGVVTCNQVNSGNRRLIGNIKVTVSMNGKTTTRDADVYQAAYVIPDYYVGLTTNPISLQNMSDNNIISNAEGRSSSTTSIYPGSNSYCYFTSTNKLMYVAISSNITASNIKIDIDHEGNQWDLNNQDFLSTFQFVKNITYNNNTFVVYATYDPDVQTTDGYRIKF